MNDELNLEMMQAYIRTITLSCTNLVKSFVIPLSGERFWGFYGNKAEDFPLKKTYKPSEAPGLYSNTVDEMRKQGESELTKFINHHETMRYSNDSASMKLHISINDFQNINVQKLLLLHEFLFSQINNSDNFEFHYKMISPNGMKLDDGRYKDHDQVTIYFDKYSSLQSFLKFAEDLNTFLKTNGIKNTMGHGPKDTISFGQAITARFDNDKLHGQYTIHTFFDLELAKFFARYSSNPSLLKDVPMCALEVVFGNIFVDRRFTSFDNSQLSDELSSIVQKQLDLIVQNPVKYISNHALLIEAESGKPFIPPVKQIPVSPFATPLEARGIVLTCPISPFAALTATAPVAASADTPPKSSRPLEPWMLSPLAALAATPPVTPSAYTPPKSSRPLEPWMISPLAALAATPPVTPSADTPVAATTAVGHFRVSKDKGVSGVAEVQDDEDKSSANNSPRF